MVTARLIVKVGLTITILLHDVYLVLGINWLLLALWLTSAVQSCMYQVHSCDVLGNEAHLVYVPMSLRVRTSALDGWL